MDIGDLLIRVLEALEAGHGPAAFTLLKAQALRILGQQLPEHLKRLLDDVEAHEERRIKSVQAEIDRLQGHVPARNAGGLS